MVEEVKTETPIEMPEANLEGAMNTVTGEVSADILKLKEELATQYIEDLKAKKNQGVSWLIIWEGKWLKDYLVSNNIWDRIMDNIKWSLLGWLFNTVDKESFEINGVTYNSVFDYLKPVKEQLDAANTPEELEMLKKELLPWTATTTVVSNTDKQDETKEVLASWSYTYPLSWRKVNSPVGDRTLPGIGKHIHKGIDIAAAPWTPILSIATGQVESVGVGGPKWFNGYGNYMVVKLDNGYRVLYGHMSKLAQKKDGTLRKVGDRIKAWEQAGLVGNTWTSTGAHLHLEIREWTYNDTVNYFSRAYKDPLALLPVTEDMVTKETLARIDKNVLKTEAEIEQNVV